MQRDAVGELAKLVRYAEPDGHNIGSFITERAGALAELLHCRESDLLVVAHEPDGELADRFRVRLDLAHEGERDRRCHDDSNRAHQAAQDLGRTARWIECGVVLDVDLVLGDLLALPKCSYIGFRLGELVTLIQADCLRRARLLRRMFMDLACFTDGEGIHFRWRAGRGRLNFKGRDPEGVSEDAVFYVDLPAHPERRPALIREILDAMGYVS